MHEEVEQLTDKLKAELEAIATEYGIAVVTLRAREVRARHGVDSVIMAKALRAAGYWLCDDCRWRAVAGAAQVTIGPPDGDE
jgi:hypothetical protein